MNFDSQTFFQKQIYTELGIKLSLGDIGTNCVNVNGDTPRNTVDDNWFIGKEDILDRINKNLAEYMKTCYSYFIKQTIKAISKLKQRNLPPVCLIIPCNWLQLVMWFEMQSIRERVMFLGLELYESEQQSRIYETTITPRVMTAEQYKMTKMGFINGYKDYEEILL